MPSSVDRAINHYLRHIAVERGLSTNTIAAYRRDLHAYSAVLAERGIHTPEAITEADVSAFAQQLREGSGQPRSQSESQPLSDTAQVGTAQAGAAQPSTTQPDTTLPGTTLPSTTQSPTPQLQETPAQKAALSASSMARMLSSVRVFHRFLLDEKMVEADVAAGTKPPKLVQRLPKAVSVQQMAQILDAAAADDLQSLRDRALLELLYATGARVSEAIALNVDDIVGTEMGAADVVRLLGKGSKQRLVPVGSYARRALDAYLVRARPTLSVKGPTTPALFLGMRGQRMSRQNAWLIIKAVAERSGVGVPVSPHTFRHSFATHLLEGGADVRVVQELLGHSSVATTQIYTLVTADTLRDMYSQAHPRARWS